MTSEGKWCPLEAALRCIEERCAWWIPEANCCAVRFVAEGAMQIRSLREVMVKLVEMLALLQFPPEK